MMKSGSLLASDACRLSKLSDFYLSKAMAKFVPDSQQYQPWRFSSIRSLPIIMIARVSPECLIVTDFRWNMRWRL
jgi:hypothetical protein